MNELRSASKFLFSAIQHLGQLSCEAFSVCTKLDTARFEKLSTALLEDAPTNFKFLDFSQFDPYFHLVKSVFTFFCTFYRKISVKIFFRPKKYRFFDENGQKPFFLKNIVIFCFNYVISML